VYLAADPLSNTVFVNVDSSAEVLAYDWDATACTLIRRCRLDGIADNRSSAYRPLAVMPPSPGDSVSHLVIANHSTTTLQVFSLPDLRHVRTHTVELSGGIRGLAADPAGISLVVFCEADMHVLPWPLEG
jgi:hypothetical protein